MLKFQKYLKSCLVHIGATAELLVISFDHVVIFHCERCWRIFLSDSRSIEYEAQKYQRLILFKPEFKNWASLQSLKTYKSLAIGFHQLFKWSVRIEFESQDWIVLRLHFYDQSFSFFRHLELVPYFLLMNLRFMWLFSTFHSSFLKIFKKHFIVVEGCWEKRGKLLTGNKVVTFKFNVFKNYWAAT